MKKIVFAAMLLTISGSTFAQKYMTRTAKINFNATTPKSPEKIEGVNNEVASILDSKSGDFVFQVKIKSFKFERELMEQHFNENYMESDKFPKAEFKGKLTNPAEVNFAKDGTYKVTVTGDMTVHGVTKQVTVPGTITVKGNTATASAKFMIKLADYKVAVPSVVSDKVAKEAAIVLEAALTQK